MSCSCCSQTTDSGLGSERSASTPSGGLRAGHWNKTWCAGSSRLPLDRAICLLHGSETNFVTGLPPLVRKLVSGPYKGQIAWYRLPQVQATEGCRPQWCMLALKCPTHVHRRLSKNNVNDTFNVWNHWQSQLWPMGWPFTSLSTDKASMIKCLA